ncbi:elongation factor TS-domain-containing protein [Desarmillaria tabescens]|uniref:Elongation factor Ts, mitochondrial n=1 Tax=Armillaria tabescens TaxID=1929756 RepID=A0AA39NH49_ARMTA|nr:elongation factor TS-domain-containing protein [Desarmillaria tabescens]KAK0465541.1 elongation factor TS-domain-containing protein [Desarmillaria tabescens]
MSFSCYHRATRSAFTPCFRRFYSTPEPGKKTNIQLIAELRKLTNAPLSKARLALQESNGDLEGAKKWLEAELVVSGAAKAAKVEGRAANQGVISLTVVDGGYGHGFDPKHHQKERDGRIRAGLVEVNCESDFVARTDQFSQLAVALSSVVARIPALSHSEDPSFEHLDVPELLQAQYGDGAMTVKSTIQNIIATIGENIFIRRAAAISWAPQPDRAVRLGWYTHNSNVPFQGQIVGLSLLDIRAQSVGKLLEPTTENSPLSDKAGQLSHALAQQIVGFNPVSITGNDEMSLYEQGFMAGQGALVKDYLVNWRGENKLQSVDVAGFLRWKVSEPVP